MNAKKDDLQANNTMLREEDEDFSDPIFASLYKQDLLIDEDLEFQNFISKLDFYHEECCGWAVSQEDFYRFKWNLQRRFIKTPNKESKNVNTIARKSFSRQSFHRTDIEFDFKHYQHHVNYIEQYRNEKMQRLDAELTDILSKSSSDRRKFDVCDQCTNQRTSSCEKSHVPKLENVPFDSSVTGSSKESTHRTSSLLSTGLFQGKKLYARPVFRHGSLHNRRENNWKEMVDSTTVGLHSPAVFCKQSPSSRGMEDSWTVIGVEKRPLPQEMKRTELCSTISSKSHRKGTSRYHKHFTGTNKCDAWVKNREQDLGGPYGAESFRITSRSKSAPNTYISTHSAGHTMWKTQNNPKKFHTSLKEIKSRSSQSSSSKMDYSCYTEMFKNVLEYYGTKKLQPKPKLPAANAENGRLLSVKT